MNNKELSILVGKTRVVGMLDINPNGLMVQIMSPFRNLKSGIRYSAGSVGDRRFPCNGRLSKEAIQCGRELLRGLYFAGESLQKNPEFIRRLRKYMLRYKQKSESIQQERTVLTARFEKGKITKKYYDAKLEELRLAEHQNVIGKGVVLRQYAEGLARQSGGQADIQSVLEFES